MSIKLHMNVGALFRAADLVSGHPVLVKISTSSSNLEPLHRERYALDQLRGIEGVPETIWSGMDFDRYFLVFEDLGPTLQDLIDSTGRPLSLNTVVSLAEQMVRESSPIVQRELIHGTTIY